MALSIELTKDLISAVEEFSSKSILRKDNVCRLRAGNYLHGASFYSNEKFTVEMRSLEANICIPWANIEFERTKFIQRLFESFSLLEKKMLDEFLKEVIIVDKFHVNRISKFFKNLGKQVCVTHSTDELIKNLTLVERLSPHVSFLTDFYSEGEKVTLREDVGLYICG